jgi:hypothetical protein
MSDRLTLAEALATDRISDFVEQAEAEGVGPADRSQFDSLVKRVTAPQPEGQTSRSHGGGASRGK